MEGEGVKIICATQRTPEWFAARRGKITASEIGNVLAKPGGVGFENYKLRLVLDMEGIPDMTDAEPPPWHEAGIANESTVVGWYSWERGVTVEPVGLVVHDKYNWLACSPDGLVGDDGLIECKYRTSRSGWYNAIRSIKPHKQIQLQLMVTGRKWCDEVNFFQGTDDRGTPLPERGAIRRHYPDRSFQSWMEERLLSFRLDVLRLYEARRKEHNGTSHDGVIPARRA